MADTASNEVVSRRRPARNADKGVVDLASDAFKEIATLVQTELQLLRAEIIEKLTVTAWSAALVAHGFSWSVAILIVGAATLLVGTGLIWLGINRLRLVRHAPSKTLDQLQKDSNIANMR